MKAGLRLALGVLLGLSALVAHAISPPSFEALRESLKASNVVLLDRNGAPLSELLRPDQGLRLEWTTLRSLPPEMLHTLLVAEDQRFFEHSGVDWRAFVAALWQNLWYERKRGASTLSMQVAGLLDPALHPTAAHGGRRTIAQKWDQTRAAQELEASWSKEQILEAYLNLVYFRGRLQGIAAAAWGLFGKPPALLSRPEAAILSVLLRAPNARAARVAERGCKLLQRIQAGEECAQLSERVGGLAAARLQPRWNEAPELARKVAGRGGDRIATTIEPAWQAAARGVLRGGQGIKRATLVVLDPNGEVLAYASSAPAGNDLELPRAANGMAYPFALARALDERRLTAASLLLAASPDSPAPPPLFSVRSAMGANDAELRLWLAAAMPGSIEAIGQDLRTHTGFDGSQADALTIAALMRALGNDGQWRAPRWLASGAPAAAVALVSPGSAFIAAALLPARDLSACRRSWLLRQPQAVWLAGLLGNHALALWVEGDGAEQDALSLFDALAESPAGRAACRQAPSPPADVVQQLVAFEPPVERARSEWFLRGSERTVSSAPLGLARIVWPRGRSIVDGRAALEDPEFRVVFEARPAFRSLLWRINGLPLGSGASVAWPPRAGRYRLELLTPAGVLIDSREFAARGPL